MDSREAGLASYLNRWNAYRLGRPEAIASLKVALSL